MPKAICLCKNTLVKMRFFSIQSAVAKDNQEVVLNIAFAPACKGSSSIMACPRSSTLQTPPPHHPFKHIPLYSPLPSKPVQLMPFLPLSVALLLLFVLPSPTSPSARQSATNLLLSFSNKV